MNSYPYEYQHPPQPPGRWWLLFMAIGVILIIISVIYLAARAEMVTWTWIALAIGIIFIFASIAIFLAERMHVTRYLGSFPHTEEGDEEYTTGILESPPSTEYNALMGRSPLTGRELTSQYAVQPQPQVDTSVSTINKRYILPTPPASLTPVTATTLSGYNLS